jgi:murein L,D-transpeptidase YafK
MKRFLVGLVLLAFGGIAYHIGMARFGSGSPPPMAPVEQQADLVEVNKSRRTLTLVRGGLLIATFPVVFGAAADAGPKRQEGDKRTPEGQYRIDWRNARSSYHLSLHISYPDADDIADARRRGVLPGGNVMIHGMPNGWGWLGSVHHLVDWTDGCIAVTNAEMREIWARVPDGTPIRIDP